MITSQLAANSFGRVVPGGVAAAGAVQYAMLVRAGVPAAAAASGMTASSLLLFGTLLTLPLLALPAILGGVAVDPHLTKAALAGDALFVLMVALGAACVIWDRPLIVAGRAAQAIRNRVRKDREPVTGLPKRLLSERDVVVGVLGREWWEALLLAAGRWLLDYLTLVAAVYAVGARPHARSCCSRSAPRSCSGRCRSLPAGSASWRPGYGNARARGSRRRRRRRGDARLPPRLVLAPDPRGRGCGGDPPAPLRRRGGGAAAYADAWAGRCVAGSSGGPFSSHQPLIAAIAGPMIRFFWKFSVSLTCGSGCSGTSTSRNSQSGSQPSFGSQTSRRSAGTVS